jgi:hypothetical protein
VLLVVLLKDVLLLEEAENHHDLVERLLDLVLGGALEAELELVVDEERQILGALVVEVDKVLKGLVDGVLEGLVRVEGAAE